MGEDPTHTINSNSTKGTTTTTTSMDLILDTNAGPTSEGVLYFRLYLRVVIPVTVKSDVNVTGSLRVRDNFLYTVYCVSNKKEDSLTTPNITEPEVSRLCDHSTKHDTSTTYYTNTVVLYVVPTTVRVYRLDWFLINYLFGVGV